MPITYSIHRNTHAVPAYALCDSSSLRVYFETEALDAVLSEVLCLLFQKFL
jgi:hypothetical protein